MSPANAPVSAASAASAISSASPTISPALRTGRRASRSRTARLALLRAELLRSHRTFTWGAIGVSLFIAAWSINLSHSLTSAGLVTDEGRWAGNILAWLSFYPDFFALIIGALVGAMTQWREQRVREGGTAWRATDPRRVAGARATVLALSALACQAGLLIPVVGYGLASGAGWGPVADYLRFAALMWVSVTGASLWGLTLARFIGGVAVGLAPVAAAVWAIIGAQRAETPTWLVEPWTWMIRTTLPLLGVHGNSVNLEPGDAAWSYPFWPGMLLQTLITVLGLVVVLVTAGTGSRTVWSTRRAGTGKRAADVTDDGVGGAHLETAVSSASSKVLLPAQVTAAGGGRRSTVLALAPVLPWRLWAVLTLPLLGLVALVRATYSSSAAVSLVALAGVPITAAVVGVTTWVGLRGAWRSLLMRTTPLRATCAAFLPAWGFLSGVLLLAWGVGAAGSELFPIEPDPELPAVAGQVYVAVTIPFVALMLLALAYALAQTAGLAASITVTVIGLLAGLVIAGNEVIVSTPGLWLSAPWGWASVAGSYPARWLAIVGLSLVLALAALAVSAASGRRVAMRDGE
ncbi:hypothetical protein [Actinomyces massiliensis]|uniref:hypothetical protein n=1 Tax=Actinomyces massiliensis TaxID=461393 RepID=UPI0028E22E30|nr:hypothetical protein [Actinomyces massiliensis]